MFSAILLNYPIFEVVFMGKMNTTFELLYIIAPALKLLINLRVRKSLWLGSVLFWVKMPKLSINCRCEYILVTIYQSA